MRIVLSNKKWPPPALRLLRGLVMGLISWTGLATALPAQNFGWGSNGELIYQGVSTKTYSTPVLHPAAPMAEVDELVTLNYEQLFEAGADLSGGIKGIIDDGSAELFVYAYDKTTGGKGALLYNVSINGTTSSYTDGSQHPNMIGNVSLAGPAAVTLSNIASDNIKVLGQAAKAYIRDDSTPCNSLTESWTRAMFKKRFGLADACIAEFDAARQPVIIELTLEGSGMISHLQIPGIGEITPESLFPILRPSTDILLEKEYAILTGDERTMNFEVNNPLSETINVQSSHIEISRITTGDKVSIVPLGSFTIAGNNSFSRNDLPIIDNEVFQNLEKDAYSIKLIYTVNSTDPELLASNGTYTLPLTFFRRLKPGQQDVYEVAKTVYQGLPVFKLSGGMSAEYAVQKSLADLSAGISHTWAVRDKPDGAPDLQGGGPVSVYSTPDFLDKAITKTIDLYNQELDDNETVNTVIISTGLPFVPYLSNAMKAPVLPLHFLVESNSLGEVKAIVDQANHKEIDCFATAGYDPSIPDEGTTWIKLRTIPIQYLNFLEEHKVKNVILIGVDEKGLGETLAQRLVLKKSPPGSEDYETGSIYLMKHGGTDGDNVLKNVFKDYNDFDKQESKHILDWESGIAGVQISEFSREIKNDFPGIAIRTITATESLAFYDLAVDIDMKFRKKNNRTITGIALNEYVIGYPLYESWKGQAPFLYWQGSPPEYHVQRLNLQVKYKVEHHFPGTAFEGLQLDINAKYDRSPLQSALLSSGFTNVFMNAWQKADVWDPTDGMNSPCELAANDIVTNMNALDFKDWASSLVPLDINDLDNMASTAVENQDVAGEHPNPGPPSVLLDKTSEGFVVKQYDWAPDSYWQIKNFPHQVAYSDVSSAYPGTSMGWIDGSSFAGKNRSQSVIAAEFDLGNESDEYDLKIGYKFNPGTADGFPSHDPDLGEQQNMDCFEYTKVPKTSWMDIPSRIMAREGALLVVNGTVYDFDYNGLPGVVPFIKMDNTIKAQPQILSFKGEAGFAWNWGANKSVSLFSRPKEIPATRLASHLDTLFHNETNTYANAMSGMTFMNNGNRYDYKALYPQWMADYPEFDPVYLGPSSTLIRCYLSLPGGPAGPCENILSELGGQTAPPEEGWNDCANLQQDEYVQRYSALAYQQYTRTFDEIPNARTYIAKKGNRLDIGIIDGDLGQFVSPGVVYTKTSGMRNWEVNNFYRYKEYDQLLNLDGGSSTQFWMNGRGPLHDWKGYPLRDDNQGPYYSRLVSSFLMLVPKKHTDQIRSYTLANQGYLQLDNSGISLDYSDDTDHRKDKAFVSLSPSLNQLILPGDAGNDGLIAGNFRLTNASSLKGAVLFSIGEDAYYPDTEGLSPVIPEYRNVLVTGLGKIPEILRDSLRNTRPENSAVAARLLANEQGFYLFEIAEGKIVTALFINNPNNGGTNEFFKGTWHSFTIDRKGGVLSVYIDNEKRDNAAGTTFYSESGGPHLFNRSEANHAMIGAVNVDGRFVTGNSLMDIDNFLFAVGSEARNQFLDGDLDLLRDRLSQGQDSNFPSNSSFTDKYMRDDVHALQFEETAGMHTFAIKSLTEKLYGLNLNTARRSYNTGARVATSELLQEEVGASAVRVYPNPAGSEGVNVEVFLQKAEKVDLQLTDLTGRTVHHASLSMQEGTNTYRVPNPEKRFPAGVYLLKISSAQVSETKKIILE